MSDAVVSWIRTVVPTAWGALITWLLTAVAWLPGVLDFLHLDPDSPQVIAAVTGIAVAAWYSVWRWAEPRIPAWLARVVLGSAFTPEYDRRTETERLADEQADADRRAIVAALDHDPRDDDSIAGA